MSDNSSVSSSFDSVSIECFHYLLSDLILVAYGITRIILVLPLYLVIFYLGVQRWKKTASLAAESHSDIITYHVSLVEVIRVFGMIFYYCGESAEFRMVGSLLLSAAMFGENLFHILTCVERYLAVVHPHTYMGLRNARGVRIRNLSTGGSWLLSFLCGLLLWLHMSLLFVMSVSILAFASVSVSFFSVSVLCVLVRPGPGDGRNYRERVDPAKHRASLTILAIWGVLWLWFSGLLGSYILHSSQVIGYEVSCVVVACTQWLSMPSCLLLPLLYLQRAGKLAVLFSKN